MSELTLAEMHYKAVNVYGKDKQVIKAIEELDELKVELQCKGFAFRIDNVISEIADVYNMLESLKIIFDIPEKTIEEVKIQKMKRTMRRIEADNG